MKKSTYTIDEKIMHEFEKYREYFTANTNLIFNLNKFNYEVIRSLIVRNLIKTTPEFYTIYTRPYEANIAYLLPKIHVGFKTIVTDMVTLYALFFNVKNDIREEHNPVTQSTYALYYNNKYSILEEAKNSMDTIEFIKLDDPDIHIDFNENTLNTFLKERTISVSNSNDLKITNINIYTVTKLIRHYYNKIYGNKLYINDTDFDEIMGLDDKANVLVFSPVDFVDDKYIDVRKIWKKIIDILIKFKS